MKIYLYIGVVLASLALLGGTFAYGYHKGSVAEIQKIADKTAETQEELFNLAEVIRIQTDALRQLQREREDLINELEQVAIVATGSGNPGVSSTGGLQRLERRWGPSPRATD